MKRLRLGRRRWLPSRRLARRSRGFVLGGLWLRLVTWSRASAVDRELARGADPMQSDELSLRVGQLRSAKRRARLAVALRGAVDLANGHHGPLITTRLRRREIRANQESLLALADLLRDGRPLGVQGLAMGSLLVGDRSSPLYRERARRPLRVAAFEALSALERGNRQHH
jgi:hypothetical protein